MSADTLTIWTIFKHPRDFPGKWVLRGFDVGNGVPEPHSECVTAESLDEVYEKLPPGLARLPRHPDDDPVIYESWV
jgi:hypothetical protein